MKVTHFCVGIGVCVAVVCFLVMSGGGCGVGGFPGWIGKALLYRMFWMVVTSAL
jgi:hypothetical protein